MTFVRATGPGGQNVNKVSSAVQLRFDIGQSRSLPADVRQRLLALAGSRATQDGVLIITSRMHRTQGANRAEARARLNELMARAEVVPKTRRPGRPTLASKVRQVTAKSQRSSSKKLRGRINDDKHQQHQPASEQSDGLARKYTARRRLPPGAQGSHVLASCVSSFWLVKNSKAVVIAAALPLRWGTR
jgi:ribosome-associated protein